MGTPLPDLTVSLTSAVSGSDVTFNVEVCNTGAAASTSFYLDLYYDRASAPACSDFGEDYVSIAGLAAGACESKTFSRAATPGGSYGLGAGRHELSGRRDHRGQ